MNLTKRVLAVVFFAESLPFCRRPDHVERDVAVALVPIQELLRARFLRRRREPAPARMMSDRVLQRAFAAGVRDQRRSVGRRVDPSDLEAISKAGSEVAPNQFRDDFRAVSWQRDDVAVVRHRVAGKCEIAGTAIDGHRYDANDATSRAHDNHIRLVRVRVAAIPRHAPAGRLKQACERVFVDDVLPFAEEPVRQRRFEGGETRKAMRFGLFGRRQHLEGGASDARRCGGCCARFAGRVLGGRRG